MAGYYSEIRNDIKIKEGMADKLNHAINTKLKEYDDTGKPEFAYFFLKCSLEIKDNYLKFIDRESKFMDFKNFGRFMAEYAEQQQVEFVGEDGERWGIYFDGKGKVFYLIFPPPMAGKEIKNQGDEKP